MIVLAILGFGEEGQTSEKYESKADEQATVAQHFNIHKIIPRLERHICRRFV